MLQSALNYLDIVGLIVCFGCLVESDSKTCLQCVLLLFSTAVCRPFLREIKLVQSWRCESKNLSCL